MASTQPGTPTTPFTDAPAIPGSVRALMEELGPVWGNDIKAHTRRMIEAYDALHAATPKHGRREMDLPYGPDERHRLDVYVPPSGVEPAPAAGRPVLMFVHGGAFVDGEKNRTPEIYANVLWFMARHGIVGVNVEFRLAPAHPFPSATEDIAAAVRWVRQHARQWGGDPDRIFLMGHSAGGTHVGHYAGDPRFHPENGSGLAGLILVSGRVRAEAGAENPNARRVEAYYGVDARRMEEGSPVTYAAQGLAKLPIMLAVAQYENPLIDVHNAELYHALSAHRRRAPRFVWLAGHNHTSITAHLNTADEYFGATLLDFIRNGA